MQPVTVWGVTVTLVHTHPQLLEMHSHASSHPRAQQSVHSMGLFYAGHDNHMIQLHFIFLLT